LSIELLEYFFIITCCYIYTHLFKEDQKDAAEKLGKLIVLLEKTPKNEKA
jgi:REP element-mobilizing transposase RayT